VDDETETMNNIEESISRLIKRLDLDVAGNDSEVICDAVKKTLIEEVGRDSFLLPEKFTRPGDKYYTRRLLHKSDNYCIVVMVWGVQQGTPIHDHDGSWCVECVSHGTIRVRSFDLIGKPEDEVVGFRQTDEIVASQGMAGSLIPPFDYHMIENPEANAAVTIHVYGEEMQGCHIFQKINAEDYQREWKTLRYTDDVEA
jgi:predicted metal-dependent enzyme (double-stranded beta helix superfamily)